MVSNFLVANNVSSPADGSAGVVKGVLGVVILISRI
jgi:hypothetical protein